MRHLVFSNDAHPIVMRDAGWDSVDCSLPTATDSLRDSLAVLLSLGTPLSPQLVTAGLTSKFLSSYKDIATDSIVQSTCHDNTLGGEVSA